jgi:hypothetical protein
MDCEFKKHEVVFPSLIPPIFSFIFWLFDWSCLSVVSFHLIFSICSFFLSFLSFCPYSLQSFLSYFDYLNDLVFWSLLFEIRICSRSTFSSFFLPLLSQSSLFHLLITWIILCFCHCFSSHLLYLCCFLSLCHCYLNDFFLSSVSNSMSPCSSELQQQWCANLQTQFNW